LTTNLCNTDGQTTKGVVEPLVGQAVGLPTSAIGVVRPPEGVIRLPAVVAGVPALRRVLMGESTGSI
jgi:hypothetical protein